MRRSSTDRWRSSSPTTTGRYIAVNAYACELLGYTRDELLELPLTDVAVNPGAQDDFDEMQRHRHACTASTVLRHSDGTELPMHLPRLADDGRRRCRCFVGVCWPVED